MYVFFWNALEATIDLGCLITFKSWSHVRIVYAWDCDSGTIYLSIHPSIHLSIYSCMYIYILIYIYLYGNWRSILVTGDILYTWPGSRSFGASTTTWFNPLVPQNGWLGLVLRCLKWRGPKIMETWLKHETTGFGSPLLRKKRMTV